MFIPPRSIRYLGNLKHFINIYLACLNLYDSDLEFLRLLENHFVAGQRIQLPSFVVSIHLGTIRNKIHCKNVKVSFDI